MCLRITNKELDGVVAFYPTNNLRSLQLMWMIYNAVVEIEMHSQILICAIVGK